MQCRIILFFCKRGFNLAAIMLATKTEQRLDIKFLVKLKKTATETFNFLHVTFVKDAISRGRVLE